MREYAVILCSVLILVMVFFLGCTTQDTLHSGTAPVPTRVNDSPPVTTASWNDTIHLPLALPAPQIVYVTVSAPVPSPATGTIPVPSPTKGTIPVPSQTTGTVPVPSPPSGQTVCRGGEQPAAGILVTGNVYGLASVPESGIDEIRFTLGLDSCSPALDLTKMQIVFSLPGTFPVTLSQGTRTSTGFFTTKAGTARVTSLNPGDQAEITFFVAPVPAGTRMNIEVKPPGGAPLPLTRTAPARISATNVLT